MVVIKLGLVIAVIFLLKFSQAAPAPTPDGDTASGSGNGHGCGCMTKDTGTKDSGNGDIPKCTDSGSDCKNTGSESNESKPKNPDYGSKTKDNIIDCKPKDSGSGDIPKDTVSCSDCINTYSESNESTPTNTDGSCKKSDSDCVYTEKTSYVCHNEHTDCYPDEGACESAMKCDCECEYECECECECDYDVECECCDNCLEGWLNDEWCSPNHYSLCSCSECGEKNCEACDYMNAMDNSFESTNKSEVDYWYHSNECECCVEIKKTTVCTETMKFCTGCGKSVEYPYCEMITMEDWEKIDMNKCMCGAATPEGCHEKVVYCEPQVTYVVVHPTPDTCKEEETPQKKLPDSGCIPNDGSGGQECPIDNKKD